MSVLGAPEPAPPGLWEAALDHALTAAGDDLGLLVPDLWSEPLAPDAVDGPLDPDAEDAWDGDDHDGADGAYEPWELDDGGDPGAGDPDADDVDPWPTA